LASRADRGLVDRRWGALVADPDLSCVAIIPGTQSLTCRTGVTVGIVQPFLGKSIKTGFDRERNRLLQTIDVAFNTCPGELLVLLCHHLQGLADRQVLHIGRDKPADDWRISCKVSRRAMRITSGPSVLERISLLVATGGCSRLLCDALAFPRSRGGAAPAAVPSGATNA